MAILASLNALDIQDICLRCIAGLNKLNPYFSDAEIAALNGASADDDLLALLVTNAAKEHEEVREVARQTNRSLQEAIDTGIIDAAAVAACTTHALLVGLFVTADTLNVIDANSTVGDTKYS